MQALTQILSAKGTAGSALTVTIPAPAYDGAYINITGIEIWRSSNAAVTGNAILDITTTNLPGPLEWLVGNAIAAGQTIKDVDLILPIPFRSSNVGQQATIVLPAPGTGVQWSVNIYYNYNS